METDITKRQYDFSTENMTGSQKVELDIQTYSHNGTLAVLLMRTDPYPEEVDEMERMGLEQPENFREYYDCATVNLEASQKLPLNVQFVDENNLPGIGDWLTKNGIAMPTDILTRSGWCLYQAYEFNVPKEQLQQVHDRRMEINPEQTRIVLSLELENTILDLKDNLKKCRSLDDITSVLESMPEDIREQVSLPQTFTTEDGRELDRVQMEEIRYTAPLPEDLPAYSYEMARTRFDEKKAKIIPPDSPRETMHVKEGTLTRIGMINMTQFMHYFPSEYSNTFLVEARNPEGKLTMEYFAMDNSYRNNMKNGECIRHLDDGVKGFSLWSADKCSDNNVKGTEALFSRMGSLIGANANEVFYDTPNIRQTKDYEKAVDTCSKGLSKQLDGILTTSIKNIQGENRNNSNSIRK